MAIRIPPRTQLSAETQLALLAISTRERRVSGTDRLAALAERVHVEKLAAYLLRHRLSMVVPASLDDLGLTDLAGALEERFKVRRDQVQAEATIQSVITYGMLASLEERAIPAIAVKGVILSERLYGDSASRESRDIDILVAPDRLEDAVAVAQDEFLYAAPRDAVAANGLPLLHYRLSHPSGGPALELHWRVHWYESASGAAMLRRSSVGDGTRRMCPVDEFASLLLFYARDGFVGLRNLAVLAAWWDRHAATLPASGLAGFAREFPELAPALATSANVAARLVGLSAAPLSIGGGRSSWRMRRAAGLADPQPKDQPERLQADIALVDLLLAPALDLRRFAQRQILLDTSYMNALGVGAEPDRGRRARVERIARRAARILLPLVARRPRLGVGD